MFVTPRKTGVSSFTGDPKMLLGFVVGSCLIHARQEETTEHSGSKRISRIINHLTAAEKEYINPSLSLAHNEPLKPWVKRPCKCLTPKLNPLQDKRIKKPHYCNGQRESSKAHAHKVYKMVFHPFPKIRNIQLLSGSQAPVQSFKLQYSTPVTLVNKAS